MGDVDAHSDGTAPVVEVTGEGAEATDYDEDFDNHGLDEETDNGELGEDPDNSLELAAMCLLYDPGTETDSEDDHAESSEALDPEGSGSEVGSDEDSQEASPSLPFEPGTGSPELAPMRPNTPLHFFYEPDPLPNVL